MRKPLPAIIALLIAVVGARYFATEDGSGPAFVPVEAPAGSPAASAAAESVLARAWRERRSDLQVAGHGVVERLLADDVDGDRHQRFVLGVPGGQTVLIAHNIDLAPRIDGLAIGDRVEFFGEYEWNPQGGVIHWTHDDPAGYHPDGWLRHAGRLYQ